MNKKPLIITTGCVLAIALIAFCYYFFYARFHVSTRDAYVHGNQVRLTPQIPGYVTAIYCENTQLVEEGQVLVTLDKTDAEIAFNKACANLGVVIRDVTKMFENVYTMAAEVKQKQAALITAEVNYIDRQAVSGTGAIAEEEYVHARDRFIAAENALMGALSNLKKAITLVDNTTVKTHPLVIQAIERVKYAYVHLRRCTISAPATGIVAQRGVQVGQSVKESTPLLAIVPLDQIWVDANFKEIHMSNVRIGQKVSMTSDFYGSSIEYNGTVLGIAGGTGAVFSALPPQNATGNWIKIVQRVPVRVSVDEATIKRFPLRLGLSMNVRIDITDRDGKKVPEPIADRAPIWKTTIFSDQEEGVDKVIKRIFRENETNVQMISQEVKALGSK